jgi:uncharacterized protein (DUF4415 family)
MRKEYDFSRGERGAVARISAKTRITINIDEDVIAAFRKIGDETGTGYQTLINSALREYLANKPKAVDAKTLRRILREELQKVG